MHQYDLIALRQEGRMEIREAAHFFQVPPHLWESWEQCEQPMPDDKQALLVRLLNGRLPEDRSNAPVHVAREHPTQNGIRMPYPLAVVSEATFLGLEYDMRKDDYIVSFMCYDHRSHTPYVERTRFKEKNNLAVLMTFIQWRNESPAYQTNDEN